MNENIEWHYMHFDLTWIEIHSIQFNSIQFNSNTLIGIWIKLNQIPVQLNSIQTIGLRFSWKKNEMQIGEKFIKTMLCIWCLGEKKEFKHKSKKTPFHAFLLVNG